MSGWKVFLTVVIVLVVIGLLAGGGYALYRLGYARGIAAAAVLADGDQLPRFYGRGMMGWDGGQFPAWPNGGMMYYGHHMPFGMFGFGGWIPGLLLLAGVVALAVWAVNAMTRRHAEDMQAPPAAVAPASVKPTRVAKRG